MLPEPKLRLRRRLLSEPLAFVGFVMLTVFLVRQATIILIQSVIRPIYRTKISICSVIFLSAHLCGIKIWYLTAIKLFVSKIYTKPVTLKVCLYFPFIFNTKRGEKKQEKRKKEREKNPKAVKRGKLLILHNDIVEYQGEFPTL